MAIHRFQKGNKLAKGGSRPGAGKKPDWFKAKMREIASHPEALKFLSECSRGKNVDQAVTQFGKVIPIPAKPIVRIQAWAEAADRGYGKAIQSVQGLDKDGKPTNVCIYLPMQVVGEEGKEE